MAGRDQELLAHGLLGEEARTLQTRMELRVEFLVALNGRIEEIEARRRFPQADAVDPGEAAQRVDPEDDAPEIGEKPGRHPLDPPDRWSASDRA
jgi:hypothetical protein